MARSGAPTKARKSNGGNTPNTKRPENPEGSEKRPRDAPRMPFMAPFTAAAGYSGPDTLDAIRHAAQQAMTAPFEFANRAVNAQASLLDEWRRNLLGLSQQNAVFKTRIQKSGRISIPDAEREALELAEGDLVQVIVIPLTRKADRANAQQDDNHTR